MTVNLPIDPRQMPDGVILIFHIRYQNQAERNPEAEKVYTYTLSKAGGLWYTSGAGRVPQAAGWGAVENWLDRDGRQVDRVEIVTGQRTVWPIQATVGEPICEPHGLSDHCLEVTEG